MPTYRARGAAIALAALAVIVGAGACVPPADPPTQLVITTELVWCGGVIPPPGEPWCRTRNAPRPVEVRQGRDVVAAGTSDSSGTLVLTVPAGRLTVAAAAPHPYPYEICDTAVVTAASNASTAVTQTCTVNAP